MNVSGPKFWNDRERAYFLQCNNPTEHILKCLLPKGGSWLETCGPTASLNCQASVGRNVLVKTPGGFLPQPEEILTGWFNDARNFAAMRKIWPGLDPEALPGNEVAQWYPPAVREVFGNPCEFIGAISLDEAVALLRKGRAIQVCLKNPGHFVAIVAFDEDREVFIIKDSWSSRWPDGDGFCKPLSCSEYETNVRPLSLVYS